MRTRSKQAWLALALLGSAAGAWATFEQWPSYWAHRRLNDRDWMHGAPPEELRRTAHQALRSWYADPHDAFLVLKLHGDESSVPFLRMALAQQPSGDAVACTWAHGQDALKRIVEKLAQGNRSPPVRR